MEYGLIGENIPYSISPQIHAEIFRQLGICCEYKLIPIARQNLSEAEVVIRRLCGVNITIPYKQTFLELCDVLSPEAQRIGAINTIHNKAGRLYGYNTDYYGFGKMVERVGYSSSRPPRVCAVLGSGGASLAAVRYLQDIGAQKVYVVSRTPDSSAEIEQISYDRLLQLQGDILVNATPVGTYPNVRSCPVCESVPEHFCASLDLIYNPNPTRFLQIAQRAGGKICSGLIMLVAQAVKSEEIWQERAVSEKVIDIVYEQMKALLEKRQ